MGNISCNRKRLIVILLIFGMIFSQSSFLVTQVFASSVDLLITGTGVKEEVRISEKDWTNYEIVEKTYSTNNSLNFHKIVKARGYDLFKLIGVDNLKKDKDYKVKFTSSDGFEFATTISELKSKYYYSDFTASSKIGSTPMIAKYTKVIADFPKNLFNPPIKWEDKPITEKDLDKSFPKLAFGQTDIDDMNMSKWAKDVVKITIGDEVKSKDSNKSNSSFKHISNEGAPYNVDAITSATFTVEGPAVEGYRAISLRQIEEDIDGQQQNDYYEKMNGKIVENSYEGINVKYLIDNYVKTKANAGDVIFKNKSRQTILKSSIEDLEKYVIAYGINEVPLVYLETDVGYKENKYNGDGCFKLVYQQDKNKATEFSNVAYIYIEEKDAKNVYEHNYSPYNNPKYTDYELIIHGDAIGKKTSYKVSDIEAMKEIQYQGEYSLSNSEYFWYYNTYKGVTLWDLLLKTGLNPNISENTSIQFIAADNYNFAPMTVAQIKDNSLYGYYEKSALDKGDGTFKGNNVKPLRSGMPIVIAYGFNGYPYVTRATDDGFNPGLGNDGGPLRVIFGKTDYNDTNGSNQVQFIKEIIVGKGTPISTGNTGTGKGENTKKDVDSNSAWTHNQGIYEEYLDLPVLRVTGSQVKKPTTFTLRQIEAMTDYALRDIYSGDGIREFEGVSLWDIISKIVGLKEDVDTPSIRVFSGQNYNQILRSNEQIANGVLNSKEQLKQIILAYAVDGYPLVPNEGSAGYANNNAFGPLRLIIEENKSMWIKWADCIVVGSGDYEAPKIEDVKDTANPESEIEGGKLWLTFKNDTGKELPEASIRSMEYDVDGNLWIGSNNGGLSCVNAKGKWTHYDEITTENAGKVKVDISYAIAQRENGELWIALGGQVTPQGVLVKTGEKWKLLNTKNSDLPDCFVQELELDGEGGLWIGTKNGVVYVDKEDKWTVYTNDDGLLPYSVDAIEPDGKGGAWIGYYPDTKGDKESPIYLGGYQHMAKDGTITTYDGFDSANFNVNWIRSISMDNKGGVWVVRSGNAPGFGFGEVDYVINGKRTVYKAKDLYPEISEGDDIRFIVADKENEGIIYIATMASGIVKVEKVGKISEKINSDNNLPSKKWNNVYFIDIDGDNLFIGTNGGAGVYKQAKTFKDIKSHWAKAEIDNMATMGYINGNNGIYRPNDNITRAEFMSLLTRIMNLSAFDNTNSPFKDVKPNDWFAKDIALASEGGLIKGYEDGTFRPNSSITRQEIGKIIGALLKDNLTDVEVDEILSRYDDNVSGWAKREVARNIKAEIIKGLPDNTFGGDKNATRAEAAVILLRFLKH